MQIIERKKERLELKRNNDTSSSTILLANIGSPNPTCSRANRTKTVGHQIQNVKNCIICNQKKYRGDRRKLRICITKRAKQFLSAIKLLVTYLLLT